MHWFSLSVRSVVGGLIGLLGLILAIVLGSGLITALDRRAAAERVALLAGLDKTMFLTSQNFRLERGQMVGALSLPIAAGKALLAGSLAERDRVDAGMGQVLPTLARLDIAELPATREELARIYADVKALRAETDAAVALPLEARDRALGEGMVPRAEKLLKSLDATSGLLEGEIHRLDQSTWDMIRAKAIAWEARLASGDNAVILNAVLAAHRAMTPAELTQLRVNDGRIKAAWGLMRAVTGRTDSPAEVREAFAKAQAKVFEGPFAAWRESLIEAMSLGVDPHFTVEDLNREWVSSLADVGAVAVAAMEVTTKRADAQVALAKRVVVQNAAWLVVNAGLVAAGFILITYRVTGPIQAMTDAMRRLADADFSTVIPGTGRSDEIGSMAIAVQVFKEGLIRNQALTQELERLATTDGMTGIFNRRHFLTLADREWIRCRRYVHPLSLLMVDIDFFKSINDRFGHDTGDKAIIRLANVAAACKRASDVLARIGGEEFALLLPETDAAQAEAFAERLRQEVEAGTMVVGREVLRMTVSIGVAVAGVHHGGVADLMKAADLALYQAKQGGRNRVVRSIDASPVPQAQAASA